MFSACAEEFHTQRAKRSPSLAVTFLVALFALGSFTSGQLARADEPPKPALAFGGPAKPTLYLGDEESVREGTVHIVLLNAGGASATDVTFRLFLDAGSERTVSAPQSVISEDDGSLFSGTIDAYSSQPLALTFSPRRSSGVQSGILEMRAGSVPPVAVELTIQRVVSKTAYWFPIGLGFLVTLAVAAVATWRTRRALGGTDPPWSLGREVYTEKAWSFTDSWATNLTAIGALLGTVLAASGFITEVLPGVPTGRFAGLSMLFGALVLVGPVLYIALGTRGAITEDGKSVAVTHGTIGGLLASSLVTLVAVAGELLSLAQLALLADPPFLELILYFGLLAGALALISIYAIRSIVWLVRLPRPTTIKLEGVVSGAAGGPAARVSAAL